MHYGSCSSHTENKKSGEESFTVAFTLRISPLAISVSIKGSIVYLNRFQMVTEDSMKESVLTAHLYGGDIDISVNVMPHQHHDYDLLTHASGSFLSATSHYQELGRSHIDLSDKSALQ